MPQPLPPPPGRRIAVIGLGGAGKSYIASTVAERLGLHYIDRDALIVQADCRRIPLADRAPLFEAETSADGGTFDGICAPTATTSKSSSRAATRSSGWISHAGASWHRSCHAAW